MGHSYTLPILTFVQSTLGQEELRTLYDKYTKPKYYSPESTEAPDMSVDAFTSFLLSPDNGVFSDQHAKVHDMTRPLSEYFISSSHNTYLVGHQLVGDSTIEGYIRALLHSCRSVEGMHASPLFYVSQYSPET
jgi:phosphatidylinositol phospholipase C delta